MLEDEKTCPIRLEQEKARLAALEVELEVLKEEKAIREKETEVKRMISELHPSVKHGALQKIESVLGEAFHELRGTPEQRAARKKKLMEEIHKLGEAEKKRQELKEKGEYPKIIEVFKESKPSQPVTETPPAKEETPLDKYVKSLKETRGF